MEASVLSSMGNPATCTTSVSPATAMASVQVLSAVERALTMAMVCKQVLAMVYSHTMGKAVWLATREQAMSSPMAVPI